MSAPRSILKRPRLGLDKENLVEALGELGPCLFDAELLADTNFAAAPADVAVPKLPVFTSPDAVIIPGPVDTITAEQYAELQQFAPTCKDGFLHFHAVLAKATESWGDLRLFNADTLRRMLDQYAKTVHKAKSELNETLAGSILKLIGSVSSSALLKINEIYNEQNIALSQSYAAMAEQRDMARAQLNLLQQKVDMDLVKELQDLKAQQLALFVEKEEWKTRTNEALRLTLPENLERVTLSSLQDGSRPDVVVPQMAVVKMMSSWKARNQAVKLNTQLVMQGPLTINGRGELTPSNADDGFLVDSILNTLSASSPEA